MYPCYFGFREKPFTVTPDTRFFYANPVYQEAYATLLCGIRERKGFVVLTGEAGTGKTTLLRKLMENLQGSVPFVFFYNTYLSFDELIAFTCNELALVTQGTGRLPRIRALNDFLIEQLRRGRTTALLIDEAQNLSEDALENLRLLSNLETESEKLLQIVLAGQPELESLFNQPEMRQLKQRVALNYRLRRLESREVCSYIAYRLGAAGCPRRDLFTPESLDLVVSYSRGIPRLINVICDNALQATYAAAKKKVSSDVIREVIRDLSLKSDSTVETPSIRPLTIEFGRKNWLTAGTLVVILFAGAGAAMRYPQQVENYFSSLNAPLQQATARAGETLSSMKRYLNLWFTDLVGRGAEPEMQTRAPSALPAENGPEPTTGTTAADAQEPGSRAADSRFSAAAGSYADELSLQPETSPAPGAATVIESEVGTPPIRDGSAMGNVAYHFYGSNSLLGLDLIMEFNPHLQSLNGVSYPSGLRFPCLTRETLQRKRPDGSYHLILASFPNLSAARGFARAVRLEGYDVVITARRLSGNLSSHRVEIAGLKTLEAANRAWETTLANRWIPFSHC
jgi:type II secretory pathway predicted ATPase ExeA